MALFPRAQERRQREQQARGATPALQPSVARAGLFRGRPRENNLAVARSDGGDLRRNIDTGAQRVVYPENPIPSPSDAIVPERGNYLNGMANLRVDPRTGLSRMSYVDGVEMTPARKMFQRGMNEVLKQQKGDPELAQGYFTRAYRFGQAQGLEGPEMDMIQQKSFDTRRNNMSLRAGTMIPYYANERDPETGAYVPPEDRIPRAFESAQRRVGDEPVGRSTRFPAGELPQMGGATPSPAPRTSAPLGSAAPPQGSAIQPFDIPGVGAFDFTRVAAPNASEFTELVPGQSPQGLLAPPQPSAQDRLSSQLSEEFGTARQNPLPAPTSPPPPTRQRTSMEGQIRSQARAENQSGVENVRSTYNPTFNDDYQARSQPVDAQAEYARRQQLRADIQRQRVAAQGDPAVNSLGVMPAPPPVGSTSLIQTNPDTGRSKVAFNRYVSDDGRFSRNAQVLGVEGGDVLMQYEDGSRNRVPLRRLDEASREQAIQTAALLGFGRGSDMIDLEGNRMPVNATDSLNRLFGSRDRNELYSSTTGTLTAGDPQAYRDQQAFNSVFAFAPPENVPIDEELVRQSRMNARNRLAKATQPGGLPDIPDPDPSRPLLAPRGSAYYNPDDARNRRAFVPLGDRTVGQRDTSGGGISNFNRVTVMDRDGSVRNVVSGMNTAIDDNGYMLEMRVNPDTGVQEPVRDQYGRPLAIDDSQRGRRFAVGSDGNIVPGSMTTAPTTATGRREAIIEQGNAPNATPEQVAAAANAREELDKYNKYMDSRDQRRQDAVDLNAAAAQLRSYGQTGQQFMGYSGLGQPVYQPVFGQTGPSRAQAIGQVKREREAQKRLDDEMARQRKVEEVELKIKQDQAAAQLAREQREGSLEQQEANLMQREYKLKLGPMGGQLMFADMQDVTPIMRYEGLRMLSNGINSETGSPYTEKEKRWYLQNQFGITEIQQLRDASEAAGYNADGMDWTDFWTGNWFQLDKTDQVRDMTQGGLSAGMPDSNPPKKPSSPPKSGTGQGYGKPGNQRKTNR